MRRFGEARKASASSRHPTWPLTPLPLTDIVALKTHLHFHTLYPLRIEVARTHTRAHTHTHNLPPLQLSSHLPIRLQKLADCDPSAPLCLNCSPTACCNEKLSVYSGYAFSLRLQLSLYFPSVDAEASREMGNLMMLWRIYRERDMGVIWV